MLFLVSLAALGALAPPPLYTVPANRSGFHWTVSLALGGNSSSGGGGGPRQMRSGIIVDTGSANLVVLGCDEPTGRVVRPQNNVTVAAGTNGTLSGGTLWGWRPRGGGSAGASCFARPPASVRLAGSNNKYAHSVGLAFDGSGTMFSNCSFYNASGLALAGANGGGGGGGGGGASADAAAGADTRSLSYSFCTLSNSSSPSHASEFHYWGRRSGLLGLGYPSLSSGAAGLAGYPPLQHTLDRLRFQFPPTTFTKVLASAPPAAAAAAAAAVAPAAPAAANAGGGGGGGGRLDRSKLFALDFNADDGDAALPAGGASALHLGGVDPRWAPSLQWSESRSHPGANYHQFSLYAPSLCGVPLLSNRSTFWSAIVDTGAACLTAPAEFFDVLMAWAPSECQREAAGVVCRLPDALSQSVSEPDSQRAASGVPGARRRNATRFDTAPPGPPAAPAADWRRYLHRLPWLRFRVQQGGPWLRLPLASLLYTRDADADGAEGAGGARHSQHAHRRYYCLRRAGSVAAARGDVTRLVGVRREPPRFSFGSMALLALYAAFDMRQTGEGVRVGFAPKFGLAAAFAASGGGGGGGGGGEDGGGGVGAAGVRRRQRLEGRREQQKEEQGGCVAPTAACVGAQWRNATNHCVDPPCARYFFQEVDPARRTCRLSPGVASLVYVAFAACVVAEVALHVMQLHTVAKATGGALGGVGTGGVLDGRRQLHYD